LDIFTIDGLCYLDCSKENTLTSDMEIWEKHESGFLQGLGALEKETQSKKTGGGQKEGKETSLGV
jgi:hypothetical protein